MTEIFKLQNKIKNYEWGSRDILPEFLGIENPGGLPCAEMWMGTHAAAPSQITLDGRLLNLTEVSGELPFLFKLLAVEKSLSIQAHPNKTKAAEGFDREEKAGLSLKSHSRNYKDRNHKPEIICAVSPFTLMAGFREPDMIRDSLEEFFSIAPPLKEIFSPLFYALKSGSLLDFFRVLFNFSRTEKEYINSFILEKEDGESGGAISPLQWKLMKNFAAQYPGDPAIISPLFLNMLTLQPGQAAFIPVGTLHAYLSGFGVELMTASDNVLRCGLTPKNVNIDELMNILYFVPFVPQSITPHLSAKWFCYHTPCGEISLSLMRGFGDEEVFAEKGSAICIVTEGEVHIKNDVFKKGESFFVSGSRNGTISFSGNYSLFAASGAASAQS